VSEFPSHATSAPDLLAEISDLRGGDLDWRGGRAFSLVYDPDDAELEDLLETVGSLFLHENALNPFRYDSLLKMETEIGQFAADLFGARRAVVTSGGTESIFVAVQTARDEAAARGIHDPTLVVCETAHPAFAKACHYLGVELLRTPAGPDGRAQPQLMAAAADSRCALLVGSAPCYPFGVIDPIPEIAAIALDRATCCHVDACLGGWILPWWEQLGSSLPPWGFAVEGVTSMSADIHKYGYTFKGASVVMYASEALYQHQIFMYDAWPGGLYASATPAGTRPAAPIAGAWTAIRHLGAEGYLRLTKRVQAATTAFRDGIDGIDGLRVAPEPDISVFQITASAGVDLDGVCDGMDERGWNLDRQQGGLHLMLSPGHDRVADQFVADLAASVAAGRSGSGSGLAYGGVVE
jgi:glutamate/tyrosine decarboxylase-like PLP-dependent enzyme